MGRRRWKRLTILDYSTCELHVYRINPDIIVDDMYIDKLGFHVSECEWMISDKIDFITHKGILMT